MNPASVSWRPRSAIVDRPTAALAPRYSSYVLFAGAVVALVLLMGFYSVVQGAVQRAEGGRAQARLALERQSVCNVFASAPSRDLCATTRVVHGDVEGNVSNVSHLAGTWKTRKAQLTARLD